MNDAQLIQATLAGNEHAFKQLVLRYESRVAAIVFGMLGKCAEAEDVGQETFIRFYHGLKNFRGEAGVGTYLTRIAINLSPNELKRQKRRSLLFFRRQDGEQWDIEDETTNNPAGGEKSTGNSGNAGIFLSAPRLLPPSGNRPAHRKSGIE